MYAGYERIALSRVSFPSGLITTRLFPLIVHWEKNIEEIINISLVVSITYLLKYKFFYFNGIKTIVLMKS